MDEAFERTGLLPVRVAWGKKTNANGTRTAILSFAEKPKRNFKLFNCSKLSRKAKETLRVT